MPAINNAIFLRDDASQILALSDALASAHGPAISAAFDNVARSRGLARIACDAKIPFVELCNALADPARPDSRVLQRVVATLAATHPDLFDRPP